MTIQAGLPHRPREPWAPLFVQSWWKGAVMRRSWRFGVGVLTLPILLALTVVSPSHANVQVAADVSESATSLVDAVNARLELAIPVAAAKFASGAPIDDPVREAQAAESFVSLAAPKGVSAARARAFIEAQFAASKFIQRTLIRQWNERPETRPQTKAPDLIAEVRPALDRVTQTLADAYVAAWRDSQKVPRRWNREVVRAKSVATSAWRWQRQALDIAMSPIGDQGGRTSR